MQQKCQGIHPKIPHRPQKRGEGGEKQHTAAHRPQQQIQPQLPLRPAEHEEEDRQARGHAVQDVQRRRQAGQPQAEGPQQVIQQRRSHAQQDRLTEEQERLGESRGHGASPEQPVEKAPPLLTAVLMHVYEDYFYPEVLNPADNSHCADGEIGELVFTTLAKEGMPLLRYRTKDLTSIDHSTCECGRTLPRISKFKGRTDDMKVIRGVNVFPTQVETALLSVGGGVAPHYLMIVDRENNLDVLTVMVEVDEKYFSDEIRKLDELKNKVAAVLKQALGVAVRVKLVEPKTIERSEGKAKRVIDNRSL